MIYYDHYDGISLFRLLKYNHSFKYIYIYISYDMSSGLIITRNFERNSSIKIKISQSQRRERDSIPSWQISSYSRAAQFPINRLFQPDIYIKPVSMAIKNSLERKPIYPRGLRKTITRYEWQSREEWRSEGRNSRPVVERFLKSTRINAGISKMTPIRAKASKKRVANTRIQISRKHTISVCKYVVGTGINYPTRPPAILAPFHA